MPATFWIATALMTTLAVSLVLMPLAGADGRKTFVALAIGMPVFAAGCYLALGSPGVASASAHGSPTSEAGAEATAKGRQTSAGSISSLVDGLAMRLEENPDDGKGWLLLAKSYMHLNRLDDARVAYSRAAALGESDASLISLGTGSTASTTDTTVVAAGPAVTGSVNLSPALRALVQPTDRVFIFARAPGQGGAPIAVVQKKATAWPIEFRLTDAQSMVEGMRLSNYNEVVVTARISRSGDAGDTLKGLEAKSPPISLASDEPVQLIIE